MSNNGDRLAAEIRALSGNKKIIGKQTAILHAHEMVRNNPGLAELEAENAMLRSCLKNSHVKISESVSILGSTGKSWVVYIGNSRLCPDGVIRADDWGLSVWHDFDAALAAAMGVKE